MKSMVNNLFLVAAIAAIVFAIYEFYIFAYSPGREGNPRYLWTAIASAIIACVCALLFFVRRVNKEEEIHITS